MSSSKSSPTNTTATSTSLTTKNLNVSGNSGFTAVGGEGGSQNLSVRNDTTSNNIAIDNSVRTTTDFGAVQAGTGLAQSALDTVAAANRYSIDAVTDSNSTIRSIAGQAIEASGSAYGGALTAVQHNTDNTVSVIQQLATQFGTALYDFTSQEQTQLGNTVSALNSTYTANNTSANQQVINATQAAGENLTATIKYIALAAAAAAALYFITRK